MGFLKVVLALLLLVVVGAGLKIIGQQVWNAGYDAGRTSCRTTAPNTGGSSVDHSVVPRPNR